jgi:hypothetical protein
MTKDFGVPDFTRLIFGFLCFDHRERNYFEKNDVAIGYIFADIMSLYFFRTWTLTRLSQVYSETKKRLHYQRGEREWTREIPTEGQMRQIP